MNLHESLTSFKSNALHCVHLPLFHSCGAQFLSTANFEGPGISVLVKYGTKTIPQGRHGDRSQGSALMASQAWRGLLGNARVATEGFLDCAL